MAKLETIERKQTSWAGLWWHPEYSGFSSEALDLSQLRKFKGKVRLYMRKNAYYNNGENGRPNYCFCLKDSNSEAFNQLEVEDDDSIFAKIERLREIMRAGNTNADRMMLASESQARADDLMREAVALIEDITGESWEFSYITY